MLIDWFIVVAQIFNFLLLVALLRWVLYAPILRIIQQRRGRIEDDLRQARDSRESAQEHLEAQQRLRLALEAHRQKLLAEAEAEVEAQRRRKLAQLRGDVALQRNRWQDALRKESDACLAAVRKRSLVEIEAIARKALEDLADVTLEHQIVRVFLERLRHLDNPQRAAIHAASCRSSEPVVVRTSFPLTPELREDVLEGLGTVLADTDGVTFLEDPELPVGIQVGIEGQSIGWTLDRYLGSLEQHLLQNLQQREEPRHGVSPASS